MLGPADLLELRRLQTLGILDKYNRAMGRDGPLLVQMENKFIEIFGARAAALSK